MTMTQDMSRRSRLYAAARAEVLAEVADLAVGDKTRDACLLLIEEHLENNGIIRDWVGA